MTRLPWRTKNHKSTINPAIYEIKWSPPLLDSLRNERENLPRTDIGVQLCM